MTMEWPEAGQSQGTGLGAATGPVTTKVIEPNQHGLEITLQT